MDTNRFAARLKELREATGWTQQQLADRAGMSKAGIADLEQGRYAPTWPTAVALAEALGVDCRAFLEEPAAVLPLRRGRPRKPTSGPGTAEPAGESSQEQSAPLPAHPATARGHKTNKPTGESGGPGKGKRRKKGGAAS